jgi:GAF domain-containing protein
LNTPPDDKIRRLLDVGRALVSELDTEAVLERILEEARAITGARYVALGVLDEPRGELERFLTSGIDAATHRAIGDLPRGRGVLGVLIEDPRPLRLADVGQHPQSYGFPAGHPPMQRFLGAPIMIRGQAWGNLYLADKQDGSEFTEADEEAAVVLAQWAATAIENARLYEAAERRRDEAERAVRSLEVARDIADAVGGVADLDRVLELIVKRGRALVDAKSLLIMLREGDDLVVAASAGHAAQAHGQRLPISISTSGQVLQRGVPERIGDVTSRLRIAPEELGVTDAHTALLVPMLHRGAGVGVLAAFDHGKEGGEFGDDDERLLRTFAQSAANAVVIKRSVVADPERGDSGLDPELETTAYRLVQEALTNTVKHAQAAQVRVTVGEADGEVLIEVQDDGVGFDTEAQTAGFGLVGMRERVYLAGGRLELQSGERAQWCAPGSRPPPERRARLAQMPINWRRSLSPG